MHRIIIAVTLALSLGGCAGTVQFLQDAEQRAAAVVAKIKAAAPIVEGEIDTAIGAICSHLPEIKSGVDTLASGFVSPGPRTRLFIQTADKSLGIALAGCTAWAATPGSGNVSFFLRLFGAYSTGKRAYMDAQAAGGT